jgi:hypothetical protein
MLENRSTVGQFWKIALQGSVLPTVFRDYKPGGENILIQRKLGGGVLDALELGRVAAGVGDDVESVIVPIAAGFLPFVGG